ncbi:MAG: pyruvate kinase, partial [Propionibacteriaceae bacterium]
LAMVRQAAHETGRAVGVMADLQGPKIRLGNFAAPVELVRGQKFTITTRDILGDNTICGTTYKGLPGDVEPGHSLLIDDGKVALVADEVTETDVICTVQVPGTVSNHKGINLPGVAVNVPALSDKDEADLRWALQHGFDIVALSFVRSATDVTRVHEIMAEEGRRIPVLAKIEKPQAMANIQEIVDAFDAVMVARGDLGVELPLEDVPLAQKKIIVHARSWAKPVVVATQMLESMISSPRPTRAEASDVANAVLDGADAVMLSGETSVGEYPILAVETMARIIEAVEGNDIESIHHMDMDPHTTGGVIALAAADTARRLGAKYLVAYTKSGDTARRMARIRTKTPVLAFTPEPNVRQELTLSWGVETFQVPLAKDSTEMTDNIEKALREAGRVEPGDKIVMVWGSPWNVVGKTNSMRVHKIV